MDKLKVFNSTYDACRYARQNDQRITGKLIDYYKEGKKSPSVAKIIENDGYKKCLTKYSEMLADDLSNGRNTKETIDEFQNSTSNMMKNMDKGKLTPQVSPYKKAFDNQMKTLYPKTHFLRDSIVLNSRISFFNEHPKPKAGFIEKLKIKILAKINKMGEEK